MHQDREVLLTAYALGELSEDERGQIETELANDAEACLWVEEVRQTASLLEAGLSGLDALGEPARESWPIAEPASFAGAWGTVPNNLANRELSESKRVLEVKTIWGTSVLDTISLRTERSLNLGDAPSLSGFAALLTTAAPYIEVPSASLPSDNFPIAEARSPFGASYVINLHESFDGYVEDQFGHRTSLDEIRDSEMVADHPLLANVCTYVLEPETTLYLQHGPVILQIRYVREDALTVPPRVDRVNYAWINFLIIAFVLHASLVSAFVTTPRSAPDVFPDTMSRTMGRLIQVQLAAHDKTSGKKNDLLAELRSDQVVDDAKSPNPGRGRLSNDSFRQRKKRLQIDWDRRKRIVEELFQQARAGSKDQGLLAELDDALAKVRRNPTSAADGSTSLGGLGTRGSGSGSGRLQSVEIGDIGSLGRSNTHEYTPAELEKTEVTEKMLEPTVDLGRPSMLGALDKEVIQPVLDDNRPQIRYCYERELQANPKLFGTVQVQWVIGPDGFVQSAEVMHSTIDNEKVEQCIVERIKRWRFAEPNGGGVVVVRLPFAFKRKN